MVVRRAADEDWPKAEPLLRASGGVLRGVAARIGARARSSSGCLLVADPGSDLIGYVWPRNLGAQMRHPAREGARRWCRFRGRNFTRTGLCRVGDASRDHFVGKQGGVGGRSYGAVTG